MQCGAALSLRDVTVDCRRTKIKRTGEMDAQDDGCGAGREFGLCRRGVRCRCACRDQDRYALRLIRTLRLDLHAGLQRDEALGRPEERRWRRVREGVRQEAACEAHFL